MHEARRLARVNAEKRRTLTAGSGQKLGGAPVRRGVDIRSVIADAAASRAAITKGCASGVNAEREREIDKETNRNGFRTKADEDDANEEAIMIAYIYLFKKKKEKSTVTPTFHLAKRTLLAAREGSAKSNQNRGHEHHQSQRPQNPYSPPLTTQVQVTTKIHLPHPLNLHPQIPRHHPQTPGPAKSAPSSTHSTIFAAKPAPLNVRSCRRYPHRHLISKSARPKPCQAPSRTAIPKRRSNRSCPSMPRRRSCPRNPSAGSVIPAGTSWRASGGPALDAGV